MRTEKEIRRLLLDTAAKDERIRAAYLEGSRVFPDIPKDIFQDYDVVYVVKETTSFQRDTSWIDTFGERLYMQYPEDSIYYPSDKQNCYGWLMQFTDGNRIDLHVCTAEYALQHMDAYEILLDKDGILPLPKEEAFQTFWIKKPSQEQFHCTCNEYWWSVNNVVKGLKRRELPYVMDIIDFILRPMLKRLLEWMIGIAYDFQISTGKSGKYMEHLLPDSVYESFLRTYMTADLDSCWQGVFHMNALFHETAATVGKQLQLVYDVQEAVNSMKYAKDVYHLPEDAKEIYV